MWTAVGIYKKMFLISVDKAESDEMTREVLQKLITTLLPESFDGKCVVRVFSMFSPDEKWHKVAHLQSYIFLELQDIFNQR